MIIEKIQKRDGSIVDYDLAKVALAISKANNATKEFDKKTSNRLTHQVNLRLEQLNKELITVEDVQDVVESVLMASKYKSTAKAYVIYRDQHAKLRDFKTAANIDLIDQYLEQIDWQVNENSNMTYSLQGLNNYISSEITKVYWLNKIYSPQIREHHNTGDFHIHDLNTFAVYCVGWDLYDLLVKGYTGVSGKLDCGPAKHFRTALGQVVNFLYTLQGEAAGAQAFSNFDTLLAPFIRHDKLSYAEVKQALQEFIFNLNVPTRTGFQTTFSNVTLDLKVSKLYADRPVIIGGELLEVTYSDFQVEVDMFNRAFIEVMLEGDHNERIFTFPIPTYNITKDFDWDNSNLDGLWKMTAKYGVPYFCNFVNSDLNPEDSRSMCPLTCDTMVIVRDERKEILNQSIGTIVNSMMGGKRYEVWTPSGWERCRPIKVPMTEVYKITTSNGEIIEMGANHLQLVEGLLELKASELRSGMFLPFDLRIPGKQQCEGDNVTYTYFMITSIEKVIKKEKNLYCFEVGGDSNLFTLANGLVTHNCRLRLDIKTLEKKGGGLFGANPLTGSIGVVTINLPRLGYKAKTKEEFLTGLIELVECASESLELKRKILEKYTDKNLYPYTKFYLADVKARYGQYWKNHFSTIGIVGMNEACLNFMGCDIANEAGMQFALEVCDVIRDKLVEIQLRTGNNYNFEATPAEGTSYRMALLDKKKFPDIICANEQSYKDGGEPFYTNSTQLPVGYTDDVFEVFDLQDNIQQKYTGGTVVHIYAGEQVDNTLVIKSLVKKLCERYHVPYFTFTPTFSICPDHGYLTGKHEECPICKKPSEIYSRVTGYVRPLKQWNDGKQAEFKIRKSLKVPTPDEIE